MTEPMKYGQTEFEVHLPPELIAAELEPNQVDLPQRTTAEHIRWALDHAQEGDIIALIGKGHEEYQEIQGVKYPFSEEQVVREHLGMDDPAG